MMFQNVNWKEFWIRAILVVVSIAVSIVVLEFILRMTPLVRLLPYGGIPNYYYQPDEEIGYDIAPNFPTSTTTFRANGLITASNALWSNNLGCFDYAFYGGEPYTLLLGDSQTWGYVSLSDNWGKVMEKSIGERVLTCGVPGFGTQQELVKSTRILKDLPNPPKTIMVAYNSNDIADDADMPNRFVYKGILIPNFGNLKSYDVIEKALPSIFYYSANYCMWNAPQHPALQRVKCELTRHSIIYLVVKNKIKSLVSFSFLNSIGLVNSQPSDLIPPPTPDEDKNIENLLAIAKLAKSHGADFKVVFMINLGMVGPGTTEPFDNVKAALDREHIAYIDIQKPFQDLTARGMSLFWPSNYHYNVEGNHLAGLEVAAQLLSAGGAPADKDKLAQVLAQIKSEFGYSQ